MLVTLFSGQHLSAFYTRFGFAGPERLYGMSLTIEGRPRDAEVGAKREVR